MRHNLFRLLLLVLMLPGAAQADVFALGEYALLPGADGSNRHELLVTVPAVLDTGGSITLPKGCRQTGERRQIDGAQVRLLFGFACGRPLLPSDTIITPWPVDGARYAMGGAVVPLTPQSEGVILPIGLHHAPARPLLAVAADYIRQGVFHILTGWDHLCFVLCLCLLVRGRQLLALITLFTLGHSISLASAFFDVITAPMPPVEAAIALSIIFMAREALLADDAGKASPRRQAIVTTGFGLLHGLGFASALSEIGVSAQERVAGLLFFNIGVETGQLLFVAVVIAVMAAAARAGCASQLRTAALYGAGIMSSVWLFERVLGFAAA
jgi:hypothetical protein